MASKATRNVFAAKANYRKIKTSIIILAAGPANRMKIHGPRPLLRVTTEKNLITHQIEIIEKSIPHPEIILVCGYEADKIITNTPNRIVKIENEAFDTTNEVRSLHLGLNAATAERVLVIYGDVVFNGETIGNAQLDKSCVFIDKHGFFNEDDVGCTINEENKIEQLLYDLPNKWAQITFFAEPETELLRKIACDKNKNRLFGFEIINQVIDSGGIFEPQIPKGMKAGDIDSAKDLSKIKQVLSS